MKSLKILIIGLVFVFVGVALAGEFNPGDIVFSKPLKAVLFSHRAHVKSAGLQCSSCHPKLFTPEKGTLEKLPDFNMKSLYKGKYCGACHNGSMAFSSDTQCARCHIGVKGYKRTKNLNLADMSPFIPSQNIKLGHGENLALFSHVNHAGFLCSDCHAKEFPFMVGGAKIDMDAIDSGRFCGKCHNGEKAFSSEDCSKCHPKM